MRISDIQFETRRTPNGIQEGLTMPGGYWVKKETFLQARAAILANWDTIDWSVKQTAKSMIGDVWGDPAVWGLNQALGRCVMFFVTHNMLPLPLEIARKRNGAPYKGGKRSYVIAGTQSAFVAHVLTTRLAEHIDSIDPRAIRVMPHIQQPPNAA